MSRPIKCRRICQMPINISFAPEEGTKDDRSLFMSIDEHEVIRLVDLEGLTQEECALRMDVARTTVTSIYNGARKKLADALINGKRLIIGGGNYVLCEHRESQCCSNKTCCRKNTVKKKEN